MQEPRPGVADIFRCAGPARPAQMAGRLGGGLLKIMSAIEACRTRLLGGHLYLCQSCGREHPLYNSCRNRHCPSCQDLAARRWMQARSAEILPVPYFHLVFTLPRSIADIAFYNRTVVFNILFRAAADALRAIAADALRAIAADALRAIAADPRHGGCRIGGTSVLHTWNQKLGFHPHLHSIVPNAGFDVETGTWKNGSRTFFAPVKVLASRFRNRFPQELDRARARGELEFHGRIAHLANPAEFRAVLAAARARAWNIYAKRPFRGPEQVFRYLSRYTHRIAIGDSRITAFDGRKVSFRYRKPRKPGQPKPRYGIATLDAGEFIRRFLLHALPERLHRIRHFGIRANASRAKTLASARKSLGGFGYNFESTPPPENPQAGSQADAPASTPCRNRPPRPAVPIAAESCNGSAKSPARPTRRHPGIRLRQPRRKSSRHEAAAQSKANPAPNRARQPRHVRAVPSFVPPDGKPPSRNPTVVQNASNPAHFKDSTSPLNVRQRFQANTLCT